MEPEETEIRALSNGLDDRISSSGAVEGGNPEKILETMLAGEALAPKNHHRWNFEGEAAVPHYLAMMLREELDISCRLGCHAAGWRDGRMEDSEECGGREAEGDGASTGLLGTDE